MTAVNPCAFLQNAGTTHTAEITRAPINGLVAGNQASTSLKSRGGVHPDLGTQLVVQQNGTPNMTVNVLPGFALVPGTEGGKQGVYSCLNDATVNIALAAADPTNPRIDIVVAKVQDSFYSGASNTWSLVIVTGTPAGSPSPPAAPANSITLAHIAVAANDTSIVTGDITDKRYWLASTGGLIRCQSALKPSVGTVTAGQLIYELDTSSVLYTTDTGTNWTKMLDFVNGPQGLIGGKRWTGTANFSSGITTTETLSGMDTGSVSLGANRLLKITVKFFFGGGTNDIEIFRIRETNVAGAEVAELLFSVPSNSFGYTTHFQGLYMTTSAVSKTFVMTAQRLSGTGSINVQGGGSANVVYFIVEDMGPSSKITSSSGP